MKTKKFSKTLVLKKETITNLNKSNLNNVKGGYFTEVQIEGACISGRCNYADTDNTACPYLPC